MSILFAGWGPYAHFDALAETHNNPQHSPPGNGFNMHAMEFQAANQQGVRNKNEFVGIPLGHDPSLRLDDIESGRL